ncbi:hypothetical protein SAMN06295974_3431 [Plantibacter flavus]|uniref:Transcriptional regulator n=1 Tax=Plantibacter flavus TaxID=150123 RepID=A0A3N2C6M9_9MICO|nr:type IV toxin-antitoxin system AbiEi family antitoxin [Plantibacter flavus]ROR83161.1 hypothetical protein EDD42_3267 [Plantibacter flavus]SMG45961.1 hypothetical protein SAMN06295974_3431 [Plantibacter flavus]
MDFLNDPAIPRSILREFGDRLHEYGIAFEADGAAGYVRLVHAKGVHSYPWRYLPVLTMSTASEVPNMIATLFLTDRITERSADTLRTRGIQYVDAAGNANLDFGGVRVDARGRNRRRTEPRPVATETVEPNLFSSKRAQVVFVLLVWPDLLTRGLRAISEAAGVSLGLAQSTVKLLDRKGFLAGARLNDRSALTQAWVAAYPAALQRSLWIRSFSGDPRSVSTGTQPLWLSGECATDLVRNPETVEIYVDQLEPRTIAENRWRSDREPNVFLRRKFWTEPGSRTITADVHAAPRLLIYADLLGSNDPRLREVAEDYRSSHAEL